MTCEEIEPLFAEYWGGTLSPELRAAVELHLDDCEKCLGESRRLEALWKDLALLPPDEPGAAVRERFYETLTAYRDGAAERIRPPSRQMYWRIAAGIALLIAGGIAGYGWRWKQASAAEITQLRGEVSNMRQLVTLSLMQQQSASERLRGVSWAYRAEPSDREVLDALVSAVNHDSNVNVRLAAVDALRTFSASPATRDAVMQALPGQADPIVQVALIDLMVDLKERTAAPELQRVASDDSINSGVRQRAEWALEKLQ